eukprot:3944797-Alexandrium_andersonii.AAC.1
MSIAAWRPHRPSRHGRLPTQDTTSAHHMSTSATPHVDSDMAAAAPVLPGGLPTQRIRRGHQPD